MKISVTQMKLPDIEKMKKTMLKKFTTIFRNSVRAFLEKLALEDVVKVDTGMARATLLPLARAVRMYTKVLGSINPKRTRPGYSIAGGEAYGRRAFDLILGDVKNPVFELVFRIELYHYYLMETGKGNNYSGPWNSLDKGQVVMMSYLRKAIKQAYKNVRFEVLGRIA